MSVMTRRSNAILISEAEPVWIPETPPMVDDDCRMEGTCSPPPDDLLARDWILAQLSDGSFGSISHAEAMRIPNPQEKTIGSTGYCYTVVSMEILEDELQERKYISLSPEIIASAFLAIGGEGEVVIHGHRVAERVAKLAAMVFPVGLSESRLEKEGLPIDRAIEISNFFFRTVGGAPYQNETPQLILVTGPVGAGKSCLVDQISDPSNVVIDADAAKSIFNDMGKELRNCTVMDPDGELHRHSLRVKDICEGYAITRKMNCIIQTTGNDTTYLLKLAKRAHQFRYRIYHLHVFMPPELSYEEIRKRILNRPQIRNSQIGAAVGGSKTPPPLFHNHTWRGVVYLATPLLVSEPIAWEAGGTSQELVERWRKGGHNSY